jgi:hypothetical protein
MELLLKSIIQACRAADETFIAQGLPPVVHIDFFRGQPGQPELFEIFELPALFIDYRLVNARKGREVKANATITVHVLLERTGPTSSNAPGLEQGLRCLQTLKLIRQTLIGITSAETTALVWESEEPADIDVVSYHILSYSCSYSEGSVTGKKYITTAKIDGVSMTGEYKISS